MMMTGINKKYILFIVCGIVSTCVSALVPLIYHPYLSAVPAAVACALFILAGAVSKDTHISKIMLIISFSLYMTCLLAFTLFGRKINLIFNADNIAEWLKSHIYLKPFNNIEYYGSQLFTYQWKTAVFNFFGNLAALAPFAFFLPKLYNKAYKRSVFFLFLFGLVSFIEIMQLILGCGIFDVDDFILNMSGSWIVYEIFSSEKMKLRFDKLLGTGV
ncbi:MAG: VanZ family protein [Eubacteriales bacterium]|nr:VanZ family protein [Eubacteriales bacterium]